MRRLESQLSLEYRAKPDNDIKRRIMDMYIDGNWATEGRVLEVSNPANGEVIGSVSDGGREDAARAIDAAAKAFSAWSGLTAYQRSDYLYRAHKIMMERVVPVFPNDITIPIHL